MNKFFRVIALVLMVASGCASPGPANKTGETVRVRHAMPLAFRGLPGYMVKNQCEPFSIAALAQLHEKGIPAHRIIFQWSRFGGERGFHAAVLFQFNGRFYFMDNERTSPREVAGKTDLGCVNHIAGDFSTVCWMVDEYHDRIAPKRMADLFAPAPAWLQQLQVGR